MEIIKIVLKIFFGAILTYLFLHVLFFGWVFSDLSNTASNIFGEFYWIQDHAIVSVLVMILVSTVISTIVSFVTPGPIQVGWNVILLISLVVLSFFGDYTSRHHRLMGQYIHTDCPSIEIHSEINGKCIKEPNGEKIDKDNFRKAVEIDKVIMGKSSAPESVDISSITLDNIDSFPFFENGKPKYLKSITPDKNNYPRIFSSGIYDPLTGESLTEFTRKDIDDFKSMLEKSSTKRRWEKMYQDIKQEEVDGKKKEAERLSRIQYLKLNIPYFETQFNQKFKEYQNMPNELPPQITHCGDKVPVPYGYKIVTRDGKTFFYGQGVSMDCSGMFSFLLGGKSFVRFYKDTSFLQKDIDQLKNKLYEHKKELEYLETEQAKYMSSK